MKLISAYDYASSFLTPSTSPQPDIPEVSKWSVDEVVDHFIEKGFPDQVHVFRDQVYSRH